MQVLFLFDSIFSDTIAQNCAYFPKRQSAGITKAGLRSTQRVMVFARVFLCVNLFSTTFEEEAGC